MSGSNSVTLKNSGLQTHNNSLSAVNQGSMVEALNVNIDRNEVVEPRRGYFQYGSTFGNPESDTVKQLINYKDLIIRHVLTKLEFDADLNGDFREILSPYDVQETETGLRIKYIEANGNLYFTTSEGIKKISARNRLDLLTQSITNSGGPKALDVNLLLNFEQIGFLEPNSKVAYRVVFGYKDLNENLILGAPSASSQIYNSTTTSCFVDLNFSIPAGVTNQYFYQVYRTGLSTESNPSIEPGDPGDEMNLVFEENVTDADLLNGYINVSDKTPEDFRKTGTLLYTNPTSGEGILQANEPPPFAKDITVYKGYTFYSNTSSVQRLQASMLSVEGIVSNVDTITVTDNDTNTTVYTFQGSIETFLADFTGSTPTDYYNVASGTAKYFTLASSSDERRYCVYFYQSANDLNPVDIVPALAGYIPLQVTILNTDTLTDIRNKAGQAVLDYTDDFNVTVSTVSDEVFYYCSNNGFVTTTPTENISNFTISKDGLGTGEDVANNKILLPRVPGANENGPTVSQQIEQATKSLMKVINAQDPLVTGYYQSTYLSVPGQFLLEGREIVGPVFYLTSTVGSKFTPTIPANLSATNLVFSSNEVRPNRIMYSKYQQPEAVPLVNFIDVGPKDRAIKRIIALRDSLLILKEDGIYRLSGDTAPFVVTPFDFSVQVLAPDTAVVLNNQIYALSTQGVIVLTDTGVSVISRSIENKLLSITRDNYPFKTVSFGVSYESERAYHLWVPTLDTDTYATQCYRYNTFTNTWTRWDKTATAGIVNFGNNTMYLGAGDLNIVEKERKTLTRDDITDRQYLRDVIVDTVTNTTIELDNIALVEKGDVLIQNQTVTIDQFNRLLTKLDSDPFITDKTYMQDLEIAPGNILRNKIVDLATKLDLDPDVTDTDFVSVIDNMSNTVTSVVLGTNSTTINTPSTYTVEVGRYLKFSDTDTLPSLNSGNYKVIAKTATSFTIDVVLDRVFSNPISANYQTDVNSVEDIQGCYNIITDKLNGDNNLGYSNYPTSTGYVEVEQVIQSVNKIQRTVTVSTKKNILEGSITLYKAIKSKIIYNPQYFGDIATDKQVREGTAIFENDNFSKFIVGYSSDKLPSFVDTEFSRNGNGDWGMFPWDGNNWGGVAAPIPLRTYVPRDKQRCRFINVKLEHKVAREKYSLFGFTLNYRPYNIRTNK